MIGRARQAWRVFRQQLRQVKAEQQGVGISRARILHQAKDIPEIKSQLAMVEGPGGAQKIPGAMTRMLDGKPMAFYTDGSLRHAFGRKVGKAARKLQKKARQRARAADQTNR